jgi:hypothetical protein
VDECRDLCPIPLHGCPVTATARLRQLHLAPLGIHVPLLTRQPVCEFEGRITQRVREPIPQVPRCGRLAQLRDERTDGPAAEHVTAHESHHEGNREERVHEQRPLHRVDHAPAGSGGLHAHIDAIHNGNEGGGEKHGLKRFALEIAGLPPSSGEQNHHRDGRHRDHHPLQQAEDVDRGFVGSNEQCVLRRGPGDEVERTVVKKNRRHAETRAADEEEAKHPPLGPLEAPRGVRQQHQCRGGGDELAHDLADREDLRYVGRPQCRRHPDKTHKHHQRAKPIVRASVPGHQPDFDEEDVPGEERQMEAVVNVIARENEHRREQGETAPQHTHADESPAEAPHRRTRQASRTSRERSAFVMKPLAPHSLTRPPKSDASRLDTITTQGQPA